MNKKHTAILSGVIITIILMSVYIFFRRDYVETNFIEKISGSLEAIETYIKGYKQDNLETAVQQSVDMRSALASITDRFPNVAIVAIADENNNIIEISRNYGLLESNSVFNAFQSDFNSGQIAPTNPDTPFFKNYEFSYNDKQYASSLYIFVRDMGNYKLTVVFPYVLDKRVLLRLAIEIFLIIIIIIIASSLLYISGNIQHEADDNERYRSQRKQDIREPQMRSQPIREQQTVSYEAEEEFDDYILESSIKNQQVSKKDYSDLTDLLADILTKTHGSEAAVYIPKEGAFTKVCEVEDEHNSGIGLVKHTRPERIERVIEQELCESTAFLAKEGQRLLLPVKKDNILHGIVEIKRTDKFIGSEVRDIRQAIKLLSVKILEFAKFENLAYDNSNTGTADTIERKNMTFYNKKLDSLKRSYYSHEIDFSVLFLSFFEGLGRLTPYQKEQALSFLVPEIKKYINPKDTICDYDNYIAILMEDAGSAYAEITGDRITEALSKFRFKVKNDDGALPVTTQYATASTDMGISPEDLTSTAIRDLLN